MSSDEDKREIARLERLNAELNASLERCRDLVRSWRGHLAANSNDEDHRDDKDEARSG